MEPATPQLSTNTVTTTIKGVPLALQRQFDVEIIDTVNALYNCVPRANVDACAVTVGCDPSDTKCLCGKLDYDFYFCLYQVRVAGNTMCDYKYSPENQPVYDFRHGFATYCTDKNLGYLSITGPSPWLTCTYRAQCIQCCHTFNPYLYTVFSD